jgi:hypothetical protein
MGRHKKVIQDGIEIEQEEAEIESVQPLASDGRAEYIKNGVTILRRPEAEKELLADGWKRK